MPHQPWECSTLSMLRWSLISDHTLLHSRLRSARRVREGQALLSLVKMVHKVAPPAYLCHKEPAQDIRVGIGNKCFCRRGFGCLLCFYVQLYIWCLEWRGLPSGVSRVAVEWLLRPRPVHQHKHVNILQRQSLALTILRSGWSNILTFSFMSA